MADVFDGFDERLARPVAIKLLRPELSADPGMRARFEREARATAMLRSIHTARVIDVDKLGNGLPYMVLEYLEGKDLEAELQSAGRFSIDEAVDVVLQVADAMAEAHEQGIVHRDLKPANLFVCRAGDRRVMKILDFGISRDENESSRITAVDSYFGTPSYASPEQLRDASQTDARTDVWSLGVILFELLTGRTPFEGTATQVIAKVVADPIPWPLDLRSEIPRELARLVMRALQRDPAQRFKTMREMSAALAPFGPARSAAVALATTPGRMRLGEILVSDGLLTRAGLECALAAQQRSGELLGRVLLDLGLVGRADLLAAIAKQQGIHRDSLPAMSEERMRDAPTLPAPARPAATRSALRVWLPAAVFVLATLATIGLLAVR